MRCHLVYSVPLTGSKLQGGIRQFIGLLQGWGLPLSVIGDRQHLNTEDWPISTPSSITKSLYEAFSTKMETVVYHLTERVKINFSPDDIFLGHPIFPAIPGNKGVTELSVDQEPRPQRLALISPMHCNVEVKTSHINKAYLDSIDRLIPKADVLFAIMGQYWWDRWASSPYAHWQSKMVRLDVAIDIRKFPRVKNTFNPPGKRGFLYIGRNDPMKGIDLLITLLSGLGNNPTGWIGGGPDIPGIPRLSRPRPLTIDFMQKIAEHFDFFITTGIADPNPTTILESMSWGFPVICTPQSGYYETPYLKNVYHDNISRSLQVLSELQYGKEDDIMAMANQARYIVENKYNWDNFVSRIFTTLNI